MPYLAVQFALRVHFRNIISNKPNEPQGEYMFIVVILAILLGVTIIVLLIKDTFAKTEKSNFLNNSQASVMKENNEKLVVPNKKEVWASTGRIENNSNF